LNVKLPVWEEIFFHIYESFRIIKGSEPKYLLQQISFY
jgi:hypothetical protein